jgi:hypothetical protein
VFLAYVNYFWKNLESAIKLFTDQYVIYRKIVNDSDIDTLQIDLGRLGEWTVENAMKINPSKSNVSFTKARVEYPLNYFLGDQRIPEVSSCKHFGIILRSDLSWADQVNYTVQTAWKAIHFIMRVLKNGNSDTKRLAYRSLVRPFLECGASCWDSYKEGQINALDRMPKRAAKFADHTNDSVLETMAQRRKTVRICALFRVYTGEPA